MWKDSLKPELGDEQQVKVLHWKKGIVKAARDAGLASEDVLFDNMPEDLIRIMVQNDLMIVYVPPAAPELDPEPLVKIEDGWLGCNAKGTVGDE